MERDAKADAQGCTIYIPDPDELTGAGLALLVGY